MTVYTEDGKIYHFNNTGPGRVSCYHQVGGGIGNAAVHEIWHGDEVGKVSRGRRLKIKRRGRIILRTAKVREIDPYN